MAEKLSRAERIVRAQALVERITQQIANVGAGAPMPGEADIDIKELHALVDGLWKEDRGK